MRPSRTTPLAAAGVVAAAVALGACGTAEDTGGETDPQASTAGDAAAAAADEDPARDYHNYVALGDSYAAVGGRDAGFSGPEFCQRSGDNYPSLLLQSYRVSGGEDVTCQGAQVPHLLSPRQTHSADPGSAQIPAQLDSLTQDTDLVALSIGGNDIDFGGIVACYGRSMVTQVASQCGAELETTTDDALAGLPSALDSVYEGISDRAPQARIIATGYVPLLGEDDDCTQIGAISPEDRAWAADTIDALNDVIEEAAQRHDAEFVLPARADEHTACAEASERWVDFSGEDTGSFPMHPTPTGHEAVARAVEDAL
ncbi:SGNH/GDSL hydrolase family protein [Dietzia timorensis]|uniref:Lipase 2 n=1 Tax=Dietzia timorensis TaxID=499555 RepID=A0A173LRK9_9ACTN|nr:SGNH/GDSL hydrolase family protein [Dietzia timorensis]ANI93770.1 Lipase 2 [Dietzia timorensis]